MFDPFKYLKDLLGGNKPQRPQPVQQKPAQNTQSLPGLNQFKQPTVQTPLNGGVRVGQPQQQTVRIAQPTQQPTIKIAQPTVKLGGQKYQPKQAPMVLTPQAREQFNQGERIKSATFNAPNAKVAAANVKQAQIKNFDEMAGKKLAPLFKQGKSYEDMAKIAGFSNDEIRGYAERNHKGYGDLGLVGNVSRGISQFVGTTADNAAGIVRKPINTLATIDKNNQQKISDSLNQINKDLYYRNITPNAAQERANELTKDLIGMKATQDQNTGMYRIGDMNTAEFAGQFAQQGIDTGSVLPIAGGVASGASKIAQSMGRQTAQKALEKTAAALTAGAQTQATSKLAQSLAAKGMNPQTANILGNAITSNAKQSAVWGTAQTGADVASGRGITPESLLMNYGADFLMGTVPEVGLGLGGRALSPHASLIKTNPRYAALNDTLRASADPAERAAVKQQMAAIIRRQGEGGFIGGPNAPKNDPTAALKQEALKYKSAEEFVKSQSPYYHRTNADFSSFDTGKQKSGVSKGMYLMDNAEQANTPYMVKRFGKNLKEAYPTKPVADLTNDPELSRLVGDNAAAPQLEKILKDRGYAGYKFVGETVVFDPKDLVTKQQLTDLYNQAHAQPTPKVEAPQATAAPVQKLGDTEKPATNIIGDTSAIKKGNIRPDKITTLSGQEINLPQYNPNAKRNPQVSKQINESNRVLVEAAINEAKIRNDSFNLGQFEDMARDVKNLSDSDLSGINLYLFDNPDGVKLTYDNSPKVKVEKSAEPNPFDQFAPKQKQPTSFEQDLQKAGLGTRKNTYASQPKDVKKAVDALIAKENPNLEYSLNPQMQFPDGIPKIRPMDFKRVTGLSPREFGIPPRYLSKDAPSMDMLIGEYERNVRGNVTGQLTMDESDFLDVFTSALDANRDRAKMLKQITEMRNDPDMIARASATLEAERARYAAPEVVEPGKADLRAYEKMMASQETAKTPATPALAGRQSQVSKTTPTQPAASQKKTSQTSASKGARQVKTTAQEQSLAPINRQGTIANRTYPDNTTEVVKRRGFAQSVKNSDEVSPNVRRKVNGKYNVRSTEKLAAAAEDFASGNIKKVTNNVLERMDTKLGTLADQDIADAISVAKKLDSAGEFTQAQQIYDKLAEHGTKQGQSIQALSLLRNRTPEGVKYHMLKSLKKAGAVLNEAEQKEVMGLIADIKKTKIGTEARDRALFATIDYVSRKTPTSSSDKLINFWRAGLLTAPKTTGGNVLGNMTELATERLWSNPVAAATDKFFSIFTGKRTKTLAGGGLTGAKEGIARGVDYLKTGFDPRSADNMKFDAPMRVNYKSKVIDHYVNGVYRWMGAQDQPFYYAAKAVAAHDLAKADGLNLGYKGGQLADYIEKSVANENWKPQTFKTAQDATKYAKYAVYQNKTLLGSMASGLKQGASHYGKGHGKAVVDFLIPFTQVPSSVAMRIIDRTPVGIVKEVVTQIRKGTFDQRAMSEAIANGSFGIPVIAAGSALAGSGLITGAYPTDQKEQKLWEAEGKQPYSVKIGDKWHSLNYMQPFGTIMSIGKQVHDDRKDGKSDAEAWMNATAAAAKSVESQSFLQGLNGALSAINDPQRSMKKYVNQTASSVIPNFIRSGATATDKLQRKVNSPVEAVQGAIPGLRQGLPAKQDMYGQDLQSKDSPLNMYANPLNPSRVKNENDATTKELRRLQDAKNGIVTTEFSKTSIAGATLTDKQVRDLNARINTEVKSVWDKTIGTENYNKLNDDDKVTYLKKIKDTIGENIKGQFVKDNGIASTTTYKQNAVPASLNSTAKAELPKNLGTSAKTILEKYDSLDTDARKTWNTEKNTDPEVTKTMQSWVGDKVKVPEVTNEIAKKWADYQSDFAEGKISKITMNDKKKAILKDAFNSQLSTDEKEIASLSKAELQYYYENKVITDENLKNAVAVEQQLFDAGLISKETLQRNLGIAARGYKTSSSRAASSSRTSSGRRSSSKSTGGTSKTSIASILAANKSINDTNTSTYLALSKLLGSTAKKTKASKNKIGREVTLKKISVNKGA